jgi:uncharacterized membrane protein YgdD (TMEM256/DUF423 family)
MKVTTRTKSYLLVSSLFMALAIMIGAFGAHGLKPYLDEYGTSIYTKASNYQFYNTLGLFIIAICTVFINGKKIKISFYLVLSGMLIFSTSLYTLALSKIMWFGAITPIGGFLMIVGWLVFAYSVWQIKVDEK